MLHKLDLEKEKHQFKILLNYLLNYISIIKKEYIMLLLKLIIKEYKIITKIKISKKLNINKLQLNLTN